MTPARSRRERWAPHAMGVLVQLTRIGVDPPLKAGSELTVQLAQSARSHHDLNLTLSYGTTAEGGAPVKASYAITAEFRSQSRTAGSGSWAVSRCPRRSVSHPGVPSSSPLTSFENESLYLRRDEQGNIGLKR